MKPDGGAVSVENRSEALKAPHPRAILECIVGSTLHGTSVDDGLEDLDLMSILIEDPKEIIGFSPNDTWVERTKQNGVRSEGGDVDRTIYGLRKFLHLSLKGNPTMLQVFFVPHEFKRGNDDARGRALQALAPHIVSKQCYGPWRGYMKQQHERLLGLRGQRNVTRPELVDKFGYDTKYAGHIIRLGTQGIEILATGRMTLPMKPEDRTLVLDVRTGKYTLAEVSKLIIMAEEGIEKAYAESTLPLWPNKKYVESWMINTYMETWKARAIK